jgi:hypothetical protein
MSTHFRKTDPKKEIPQALIEEMISVMKTDYDMEGRFTPPAYASHNFADRVYFNACHLADIIVSFMFYFSAITWCDVFNFWAGSMQKAGLPEHEIASVKKVIYELCSGPSIADLVS